MVKAYVNILGNCKKPLIQSARLEAKFISEALDKIQEDLDVVIDMVNTLEDTTLEELGLSTRDDCIYSL